IQVLSSDVGARRPLGVGVSGVALLTCASPEEVDEIIEANRTRLEFHGLTPQSLLERVNEARESGYAYTATGVMPHTRAVSVPVLTPSGEIGRASCRDGVVS